VEGAKKQQNVHEHCASMCSQ